MRGRIKRGSGIFQDHHFGKWPACCPPAKDPDMVFDVNWTGRYWDCVADGYGVLDGGKYGNGSIFVSDHAGIELVRG